MPRERGGVDLFRSEQGHFVREHRAETALEIAQVRFTQAGTRLLVFGSEGFEIWDAEAMERLSAYGSGLGAIWRVAIDPNAHFIAAKGDYGGSFVLYEASDGTQIATIPPLGTRDAGIGLCFAPDGSELAMDDAAGGLFLLDFRPESWAARVRRMVGRDFTPVERRTVREL
ncbi:hypothetical protein [uncultured Roseobacter sp.]|uniref:hypothetical protein n=1 Tax=uncultured Roseobacter sp. TaxID=114847 RepID=UPI00262F46A1|nr:hypothetical protein [uncultured Roseobacter sp.]